METKQLVLNSLKPKVKAFGFNAKELESVAAEIADNLTFEEDASEEDKQTAIDTAVDYVVPFLKTSQMAVTRIVNARKQTPQDDDPDDDPQDQKPGKKPAASDKDDDKDEVPAWAKALIDSNNALKQELSAMKAKETSTSRKARLEELIKDAGTFGKSAVRQFERMTFANDEEFDAYLEEVKEDIKTLNQERTAAGLSALGNPPSAGGGGKKENEEFSDEELKEMAEQFR